MRNFQKLILIVPLVFVLGGPLGGCASFAESAIGLPTGILTKSVQNPITIATLDRFENSLIVGAAALNTYKNYCNGRPVGDRCDAVVATMQGYSKKARPLLRQTRSFVRKNDQVNAKVVFEQIKGLVAAFRATAAAEGIPLPLEIGAQ